MGGIFVKKHNKRHFWFAAVCLVVASVTAAILIKSIFFRIPTEFDLELLPTPFYFTTQSNIFVTLWLFYIVLSEIIPQLPKAKPVLGLMVSCYISVTCIVYWLVLVPMLAFVPALFTPQNIWMHTVTSIFVPAMFLLGFTEGKKIKPGGVFLVLVYPICYIVFAYVVHAFTGKYAYPFLNPQAMGNSFVFVITLVLIAGLILGLGFAYRNTWNKRNDMSIDAQSKELSI